MLVLREGLAPVPFYRWREAQEVRSLLKVQLPLSGRGSKQNPATGISLRKSAQPHPGFSLLLIRSRPNRHSQTNWISP